MAETASRALVSRTQGSGVKRALQLAVTGFSLVIVLAGSSRVCGQQPKESVSSPASAVPSGKRETTQSKKHKLGPLEISGSWRVRGEGWDWFQAARGDNSYGFGHSLLSIAIGQQSERFDWRLEGAQDAIFGLPTGAVLPAPQGQLGLGGTYYAANGNGADNFNGFVQEAFIRIKKLGNGSLRLGRFTFLDGTEVIPRDATLAALVQTRIAQRLIGNFGWSAVGRSYDGGQFSYKLGKNNLTFLAARPTRGVFQIDAMGEVDVDLYYGTLTIPIEAKHGAGELRVFSIGYADRRTSVLKTDNRPLAVRAADHQPILIGTYGADYLHVFNTEKRGKFNFLLWGALQSGSWGVQRDGAGAFFGEFGWQPPELHVKPWISVGYSYGSGDGNPDDSHHGTFFQILPTPRPYARFPFYNMMNNEDFYASFVVRPHARLSLRSEVHALRLNKSTDLWYLGGGVFQPNTFGYTGRPSNGSRSLADVADLSADYQMTGSLGITLYYAHAWGKSVIAQIYPNNPDGQLAYVETNLRF